MYRFRDHFDKRIPLQGSSLWYMLKTCRSHPHLRWLLKLNIFKSALSGLVSRFWSLVKVWFDYLRPIQAKSVVFTNICLHSNSKWRHWAWYWYFQFLGRACLNPSDAGCPPTDPKTIVVYILRFEIIIIMIAMKTNRVKTNLLIFMGGGQFFCFLILKLF